MFKTTIQRRIALIAGCAIFFGAGAIAIADSTDNPLSTKPALDASTAAPAAIDPSIAAHFGILRRAVGASDAVEFGPGMRDNFDAQSAVRNWGLNVAEARRGQATNGSQVWVAPATNLICLLSELPDQAVAVPATTCQTLTSALQGKALLVVGSAPKIQIAGIVPDGVDSVTISFDDGSSAVAPVQDNTYVATVARPTASVKFDTPAGPVELAAPSADGPAVKG